MTDSASIVGKVWNYAHVLRDDGVTYGDYIEQITYLLFLKMAEEREALGLQTDVPADYNWQSLTSLSGDPLEIHYRHTLEDLGKQPGLLGTIFKKAQNKISDPAKLEKLVGMIDSENWSELNVDVKGDIYEGLLEKNAGSSEKGAGQYFTPRPLIEAMVEVMQPEPGQIIFDPACGTGGFLLAAHDYIAEHYDLDPDQKKHLRESALRGTDVVPQVVSLCAMNLVLHGIRSGGTPPIASADSLASSPKGERPHMVLTNPPFGKKSSYRSVATDGAVTTEKLVYEREDFITSTSNKQLNFVQHICSLLAQDGRAAVVLPDNVLFEGGAGEQIRQYLLKNFDVHTLLRLPTGIFYAQGVKANVLFFDKKHASDKPWTQNLWIYDFRTNIHFTLKTNPLKRSDLDDFIKCYHPKNRNRRKEAERFKKFTYDEIIARDKANLDIFWLKDESLEDTENLPSPNVLAAEIVESLESALEEFRAVEQHLA